MALISDKLNKILSAVFGKDVRQALHDGLDAINRESENTTARQKVLEETFDHLTINAGNSNAEIVAARVKNDGTSFDTIGKRLNDFDEHLETKANKNDVAKISSGTPIFVDSVEEMTDTTKNYVNLNDKYVYIYNGSGFEKTDVLYQAQGIEDKSVTSEKIDDDFVYDTGIYESAKLLTMSNLINNYNFRKGKEGWLFEYNTTGEVSGNEVTVNPVTLGRIKSNSVGVYEINRRFYVRFEYKTTGVTAKAGIVTTSNNNMHPGSIDLPSTQNNYGTFSTICINIIDGCDLSFEVICNSKNNESDTFSLRNILLLDLKEVFPTTWQTVTKEEVESFIDTYTTAKSFLKQKTDIVDANGFINDDKKNKGKFFVSKNNTDISITYKYDNNNDMRVTFGKRGGNNIFDLKNILKIPNTSEIVTSIQTGNSFYNAITDTFGPYIVEAINNIDGDNPSASGHFTGGNHNYNNSGNGQYTATGRTTDIIVKVNGFIKDEISEYVDRIDIYWTNYIQGYNTKKVDGSGREILKETYHMWFDGEKFNIENFIEALEEIKINLYYGMQLSYGAWNDGVLYLNSSIRGWQPGSGGHYGYNKKCNKVRFKKGNDYAEMLMSYDGIGDKELSDTNYGAVTFNYGKSYFYPLNIPTTLQTGEVLTFNGYYKFYSN